MLSRGLSRTFVRHAACGAASISFMRIAAIAATMSPSSCPFRQHSSFDISVNVKELADGIINGQRRSLSRAITLIESRRSDHRDAANDLLVELLKRVADRPYSERNLLADAGVAHVIPSEFTDSASTTTAPAASAQEDASDSTVSNSDTSDDTTTSAMTSTSRTTVSGPKPRADGLPHTQLRIGISGTPGVGKSTFIESFGMHLIEKYGLRVAVLSIDPSSQLTGGSILGDKTRMMRLAAHDHAFVRPSPSRGTLGGVAQDTAEGVLLCEAAGYDVVLVETVGVGQSEVSVAQTVDMVVLLMNPGSGDELQGIKKGIMELADLIVVTKADGALLGPAQRTKNDYERSLHFFQSAGQAYGWNPQALLCSVLEKPSEHMDKVWRKILEFESAMLRPAAGIYTPRVYAQANLGFSSSDSKDLSGALLSAQGLAQSLTVLHAKRAAQRRQWMWTQLSEEMLGRLRKFSRVGAALDGVERALVANLVTPRVAAKSVFEMWLEAQKHEGASKSTKI